MELSERLKEGALIFRASLGYHDENSHETFPYMHTAHLNHKMWVEHIKGFLKNPAGNFDAINECINFSSWKGFFEGTLVEDTPKNFYGHLEEDQGFENYPEEEVELLSAILQYVVNMLQGTAHLKKDLKEYG